MTSKIKASFLPYVLPFAVFAVFIYAAPALGIPKGWAYPIQTGVIAGILIYFWDIYRPEIRLRFDPLAIVVGVAVFGIWILPEGWIPTLGESQFNPYELASGPWVPVIIGFRLLGAVVVVPVMEELFWRSFALRYIIDPDFKSVPLGQYSLFSFLLVSVAFGFEHHRWLVGILAGMAYAGLLYRSKNLFSPILAHAVTNLLLGIYVLYTGQWSFW